MLKKIVVLLFLAATVFHSFAQQFRIGVPFIRHFNPEAYKADNQNWSIALDDRGVVYFANNFGILQFNGTRWSVIASARNFSYIRNLAIDNKGRIYAGAYNDFGYVEANPRGMIQYKSLFSKIPPQNQKFNDVWQIWPTDQGVYFHSSFCTFKYTNDTILPITYNIESTKSFCIKNRIFLLFSDGLKEIVNDNIVPIPSGEMFKEAKVAFMLPFGDNKILIGTESKGLFIYDFKNLTPLPTEADQFIKKGKLYCGITTSDNQIALGTLHYGIIFVDLNGKMLMHLSTDDGLQNNTILSMKLDFQGNLWVTMDQGIDYIELASPFTRIQTKDIESNIYSINLYNNKLYVATHHGLFWHDWQSLKSPQGTYKNFNHVPDISEISWSLTNIDGRLFLGHDNGTYVFNFDTPELLSTTKGGWLYKKMSTFSDMVIGGNYTGIELFKKYGNNWQLFKSFNLQNESCRNLEEDNEGNIWITSGYGGYYRTRYLQDKQALAPIEFYDQRKGLPQSVYFGVFKINNEVVFATQRGLYRFNKNSNKMEIHPKYYNYFKDIHIRKLSEDKNGNIWFIAGDYTGLLAPQHDGSYQVNISPFQKISSEQLPGFENFSFIDNDYVMFGTKHGIIVYNNFIKQNTFVKYYSIIDQLFTTNGGDSIIYQEVIGKGASQIDSKASSSNIKLPYSQNSIRVRFSSVFYESAEDIKYKYILEGFDEDWSDWTSKNEKEYTNLPENNYIFRVKSKNIFDFESTEAVVKFQVLAPWYRSKWAYATYLVLVIATFWIVLKIKNKQFEKEKRILERENQKALRLKIAEHLKEKLQEELKNKSKELAAATMNVAQKNEVFIKVRDSLNEMLENTPDKERRRLNSLIKLLDDEINDESYWEQFELHFNALNDDFLNRLKKQYTELTHKDLKMCAFIRMNLSNKEIASLLNITTRGVEASRLRLRKKIDLDKDTLLTEFILHY